METITVPFSEYAFHYQKVFPFFFFFLVSLSLPFLGNLLSQIKCFPASYLFCNIYDRAAELLRVWNWKYGMILLLSTSACHSGMMLKFVFPNLRPSVLTLLLDVIPQVFMSFLCFFFLLLLSFI